MLDWIINAVQCTVIFAGCAVIVGLFVLGVLFFLYACYRYYVHHDDMGLLSDQGGNYWER